MSNWISVKNELPANTDEIVIFDDEWGFKMAWYDKNGFQDRDRWYNKVSHWQHLTLPEGLI